MMLHDPSVQQLLDALEDGARFQACYIAEDLPRTKRIRPFEMLCEKFGIDMFVSPHVPAGRMCFVSRIVVRQDFMHPDFEPVPLETEHHRQAVARHALASGALLP